MAFFIENGIWKNVFAVPCDIVDKHIKLCSALSLKVLMVLLRSGGDMDIDTLSGILGQSRADVQDAVNYWVTSGIVFSGEADSQPANVGQPVHMPLREDILPEKISYIREEPLLSALSYTSESDNPGTDTPERKAVKLTSSRPRITTQEINDMSDNDPAIGHLLQETQSIIGKPLTPLATDVIAALYTYYGMKPDIILMLVQYCVSIGKDSVHYMEKVAASWLEKGISSHELAEAEIVRLTKQQSAEGQIRSMFGINGRALVSSERKYIEKWIDEWKMELPLIETAFERSVELKGKLSFAYINGILGNWHEAGITSAAQAMREINKGKTDKRESKIKESASSASYDMTKLENFIESLD